MPDFGNIQNLITSFNWHTPSWDLFVILAWLVASVMYASASGRGRILSVLVSLYMAKLLVLEMPFLGQKLSERVNITDYSLQQLAAFVVLFLLLFVFLGRYAFRTALDRKHFHGFIFS